MYNSNTHKPTAHRTLLMRWLADGHDGAQDALLPLYSSPDGTWYCRTAPDSLAAVYPIRLKHFPDPTMLSALLQVCHGHLVLSWP